MNITKEILQDLYWEKNLSLRKIAKRFDVSYHIIRKFFKKFEIKTRTKSEALSGKNHPQYGKRGKQSIWFGRKHSKKTKEKLKKIGKKRAAEAPNSLPSMLGKRHSNKTKEKMSSGKLGSKNPFFGKQHSKKTKQKISQKNLGKFCGCLSPHWKGGITKINFKIRNSTKYKKWREQVFERDQYTCQKCGDKHGGNLNADHIIPFSFILKENKITSLEEAYKCLELWDKDNGRTLCVKCHKQTSTYGEKAKSYEK